MLHTRKLSSGRLILRCRSSFFVMSNEIIYVQFIFNLEFAQEC